MSCCSWYSWNILYWTRLYFTARALYCTYTILHATRAPTRNFRAREYHVVDRSAIIINEIGRCKHATTGATILIDIILEGIYNISAIIIVQCTTYTYLSLVSSTATLLLTAELCFSTSFQTEPCLSALPVTKRSILVRNISECVVCVCVCQWSFALVRPGGRLSTHLLL